MARPSWVNVPLTDVDQDSPGKTGDVFQAVRDNPAAARILLYGIDLAEDTHTGNTSWTAVVNGSYWLGAPDVADYAGIQRRALLLVECKISGGVTGEFRLVDVTGATNGATKTTTSASYVHLDLEVDLPATPGLRQFRLEFRTPNAGQTVAMRALDHYTGRLEY